ncbi:unnamed protein product [Paramecium sonneborni]|uniref:Transmembrane protein n=1 Tax=Paramecium sonneborni TaxID=65129 RepID=A0A8S1KBI2_9CILI|nr:unnamed protein product [Paramecium sonneborni]
MLQNDHNLCLIHKAREEFICVNSICMDKQKKLSCYKCLEALHIYHHNPNEDFKSIYAIIEQITLEKEERLIILENAKQWNLDQKKKKRQELEKSEIFSTQYKNKLQSQIDQQFDQSCKKINEIQKCLEEANPYHPFFFSKLISLYKQNIEEFTEQIDKIKIKTLGNNLLLEQNSYIDLIECVKKLQEKNQILENKVDQLSIQKSFQKGRNNFYSVVFLSLFTIFVIFNFIQRLFNPFIIHFQIMKKKQI